MEINKEILRKEIHRRHKGLDAVREVIDALPNELPGNPYVHAGYWAAYIDIPYDWELYKAIRRALGGDWHSSGVHEQEETGQRFFILRLHGEYGKDLFITLQPMIQGSDCHLEKVGERTVELFTAVCN